MRVCQARADQPDEIKMRYLFIQGKREQRPLHLVFIDTGTRQRTAMSFEGESTIYIDLLIHWRVTDASIPSAAVHSQSWKM